MVHKLIKYLAFVAVMIAAVMIAAARAGDYPQGTVKIVVPSKPGGGNDTIARAFAKAMGQFTEQAVIVESLPGGLGNRAHLHVKNSKPDGLTMMLNSSADFTSVKVFHDVPYSLADYACIGGVYQTPAWLVSHKDSRFYTFQDLIDYATEHPGEVSFATGGIDDKLGYLAKAIIRQFKLNARIIPFGDGAAILKAVLANQVSAGFITAPMMLDSIKAGEVRVLAVGGKLDGINYAPLRATKTFRDYGVPLDAPNTRGLYISKNTPPEILAAARALVRTAAESDVFKAFGESFGFKPIFMSGEDFCGLMRSELKVLRKIKADFYH